jgi:prepilin-type N-terminal cleavage/methylation domain-containing protein
MSVETIKFFTMKFWRNQKGFSLLELAIGVSLLGGISLITMKMIEIQQGNQAFIKANSEIAKTVSLIQAVLNKPENCTPMLRGVIAPTITAPTPIAFLKMETINRTVVPAVAETRILLQEKLNYGDFYLNQNLPGSNAIELVPSDSFQPPVITGPPPSGAGKEADLKVVDLVIRFRVKQLSLLSWTKAKVSGALDDTENSRDALIIKKIPVNVTVDRFNNQISSCGAVVSYSDVEAAKKFCDALNTAAGNAVTVWDTPTKTCKLQPMDCTKGFIPKTINKLGKPVCVPAVPEIRVESFFDTTECTISSGFQVKNVGGKMKIICP